MERVPLFGLFGHKKKKKKSVDEGLSLLLQNDVSATLKCLRYTQLHHRSRWGQTDIDPALQTFSLVPMIPVCKNKWEHWLKRLFVGKRPPKHCSRSISWGKKKKQARRQLCSFYFVCLNLVVFQARQSPRASTEVRSHERLYHVQKGGKHEGEEDD